MSESSIATARQAVNTALAVLRAESSSVTGQELIDQLKFLKTATRQCEHDALRTIARLDREGEFAERGVRPAPAVADLLRCRETEARRLVAVAASVFPTSLHGQPLQPKLPGTAMALGGWEIDQAHAEVIERVLRSDAAGRLDPRLWANVEIQLADLARIYRPDQLAGLARDWIEQLDQDGSAPTRANRWSTSYTWPNPATAAAKSKAGWTPQPSRWSRGRSERYCNPAATRTSRWANAKPTHSEPSANTPSTRATYPPKAANARTSPASS